MTVAKKKEELINRLVDADKQVIVRKASNKGGK